MTKCCFAFLLILITLPAVCVTGQEINYEDSTNLYFEQGDYKKALDFAEINCRTKFNLGELSKEYINALDDKAIITMYMGNYNDAGKLFLQIKEKRERKNETKSIEYLDLLNNLGNLYYYASDNENALKFYSLGLNICRQINDSTNALTVRFLANIGNVQTSNEMPDSAVKYLEEAIALEKDSLKNLNDYCGQLNNLGLAYFKTGNYDKAFYYYSLANDHVKKGGLENKKVYQFLLNNLAVLLERTGNYSEAELMLRKIIKIRKRILGITHPDYVVSVSNLAALYIKIGNFKKAEQLLTQALEAQNKSPNPYTPEFASSMNNLGKLYEQKDATHKANFYYQLALKILENAKVKNDGYYADFLNNAGNIQLKLGKRVKAGELLNKSATIQKKIKGEKHPDYAQSLLNLAMYNLKVGKTIYANELCMNAVKIYAGAYGEQHLDYVNALYCLARINMSMNRLKDAEEFFEKAIKTEENILLANITFFPETELIDYLNERERFNFTNWQFYLLSKKKSTGLLQTITNNRLLLKNISVINSINLSNCISQSRDTVLTKFWKKYKEDKMLISKVLGKPKEKRRINADSLESNVNDAEKEIFRRSGEFQTFGANFKITWENVKQKLQPGEAAINFVKFPDIENKTIYYGALIITAAREFPVFIKLCDEKALFIAVKNFPYKSALLQAEAYNVTNLQKNSIYQLLWKPLEQYIKKGKKVYFLPDGLLHHIAFSAIRDAKNIFIGSLYKLIQLTSFREIAFEQAFHQPKSALFYGGINYTEQIKKADTSGFKRSHNYLFRNYRKNIPGFFAYLKHTRREVTQIAKMMEKKSIKTTSHLGKKATELSLKTLTTSDSLDVIHIATHGFCLPPAKNYRGVSASFKTSENPLLRTGLVMAGGNNGWAEKINTDDDDGILTALEIADIPLSNTQLVVLSACETANGEIHGNEGLFGLQRAFKMAGVKYVMAALWQVPDEETKVFMNHFYQYWLSGNTIQEAFYLTQQAVRKLHPNPFFWAAFTLVE